MNVLVAGASGLIGRAVVSHLRAGGHAVRVLVRNRPDPAMTTAEVTWDPRRGRLAAAALDGIDAVINLSGENIAGGRWTAARRDLIRSSRVAATRTLVEAIAQAARPPTILISASGTGIYGDGGASELTERSPAGTGFLADVCRAWEAAGCGAATVGTRVVCTRFGLVLAPGGGALAKLRPVFKLGLGGRLGSGRQWMSWIALTDVVRAIETALIDWRWDGPVNVVSPEPVTNRQFTAALARALRRPAVLPVPRWALRLAFGDMGDETLLVSTRARPARLEEWKFGFALPTLEGALASCRR
jgi:uncharacterized protein (TIGR01777 family)